MDWESGLEWISRGSPVMTSSFTWHHFSWWRAPRDNTSSTSPDMKRSWIVDFIVKLDRPSVPFLIQSPGISHPRWIGIKICFTRTSGPRFPSFAQSITACTPKSVWVRSANLPKLDYLFWFSRFTFSFSYLPLFFVCSSWLQSVINYDMSYLEIGEAMLKNFYLCNSNVSVERMFHICNKIFE